MRQGAALIGVLAVLSVLWTAPDTHLHSGPEANDKVLHSHAVQAHEHSATGSSVAAADHDADYPDLFSGLTSTGTAAVFVAEKSFEPAMAASEDRFAAVVIPFAHAPPQGGIPLLRAPPA
jgi:hypothetical protein